MTDDKSRMGSLLLPPRERADVVVDTDAFNEVDDQFALAYLLKNRGRVNVEAVYAAPFLNRKVSSPAEGTEKSREEILRVLDLAGESGIPVHMGAASFLRDGRTPSDTPAVRDLIRRAMAHSPDRPLYVLAIAAATDVASALLLEPAAADRMVVVWLGGSGYHRAEKAEFNLIEDVPAAQVLFNSGVPLVQVPAWGVSEHLTVSRAELESRLLPGDPLCRYLAGAVIREMEPRSPSPGWTKSLWDVAAAAWFLNGDGRFLEQELVRAPVPLRTGYEFPQERHWMGYVSRVRRDALISDLFRCLREE